MVIYDLNLCIYCFLPFSSSFPALAKVISDAVGGRNRGGGGRDPLIGTTVKIRAGPFKGYRGVAKEVTGKSVRVELESQMKVVIGKSCAPSPSLNLSFFLFCFVLTQQTFDWVQLTAIRFQIM